jgi:carbamoyltransferase
MIIGISAYYHDSAVAVLKDGEIIAAAQEERFTRKKHDARFPHHALDFCLKSAACTIDDVEHIVFYDKPFLKFERLLDTYVQYAPRGFRSFVSSMPVWIKEKLFLKQLLIREIRKHGITQQLDSRLLFSEHHLSHAASAFFPSPFQDAAVLTMDGVGEWTTTSLALGRGNSLSIIKDLVFPNSLGLLYSAFTYYLGFKVNSGEYKLMGLAPYGEPRYVSTIYQYLIDLKIDGTFRLNQAYFDYCVGLTMTNPRFNNLFGGDPRKTEEPITQRHMDLAASIQAVTEEIVLRLSRSVAKTTGMRNLCLAGGVALNCVANGKILKDGQFENLWVQPAAGDAGGALGAAYSAYHLFLGRERRVARCNDSMKGGQLGPCFTQEEIEHRLSGIGARFDVVSDEQLFQICSESIAAGEALAWFQGRMEFGPRALGARSILADPRLPATQKTLNLRVKYRESFRPFAPAVLKEKASEWFDLECESPYMSFVVQVNHSKHLQNHSEKAFGFDKLNLQRSVIPAVTHIDYSARVQTVDQSVNPRFYSLILAFYELTGCPVVVNTSFNVRGEPIVCTPEEAFNCFMGTDIESLAIGNCYIRKERQDQSPRVSHVSAFEPD